MSNNKYFIQCKLKTLLSNAVKDGDTNTSFQLDNFTFKHSDFNYRDGWVDDYWLIGKNLVGSSYQEALIAFYTDLDKLAGKIEFIGQSYVGYPSLSPTLVIRQDYADDLAFFRYAAERKSGGLMFTDKEKEALDILATNEDVPNNFYTYWSAATKTKDYSGKLLVLFAAIESLVRKNNKTDFKLRKNILGEELDLILFEQKKGLRHRLSHGEHLAPSDTKRDYATEIHKKLMHYFNANVFGKSLLQTNVVSPQRTDYENFEAGNTFVKTTDGTPIANVNDILKNMDGDRFAEGSKYEYDYSDKRENY